jgi:hypothetical protein
MASAGPYQARMQPTPPIKGSFPLDHEKVCTGEMIEYMLCLQVCMNLCSIVNRQFWCRRHTVNPRRVDISLATTLRVE